MCPQEVPLEQAQEDIQHQAHHAAEKEHWIMGVALTAALLAVLAAITALLGEHHANEALITQIRSSDTWAHYQAKSIKANVLKTKMDLMAALDKKPKARDEDKLKEYESDQKELFAEATELEGESKSHLKAHTVLAKGVTMFQVAIAIGAISVLTRRKPFWYVCMGFGAVGAVFLVWGLAEFQWALSQPKHESEAAAAHAFANRSTVAAALPEHWDGVPQWVAKSPANVSHTI
jgi:hypothetical protein